MFSSTQEEEYQTEPLEVDGLKGIKIVHIDAGGEGSIAISEDNKVYAWGNQLYPRPTSMNVKIPNYKIKRGYIFRQRICLELDTRRSTEKVVKLDNVATLRGRFTRPVIKT